MTLDLHAAAIELPPLSDAMRRQLHRAWLRRQIAAIGARASVEPDTAAGQISHKTAAFLIDALPSAPPPRSSPAGVA